MNFQELRRKVNFSLAVSLQYDQLRGDASFWESLTLADWIDLYFGGDVVPELKKRAFDEIKRLATTFTDFSTVFNRFSKETPLSVWAEEQVAKTAQTFGEVAEIVKRTGRYDFDRLLELATCLNELRVFCDLVISNVREIDERNRLIDSAIGRMSALQGVECKDWIAAYNQTLCNEIRRLAEIRIQGFNFPTETWLHFHSLHPCDTRLQRLTAERAIASAASFEDYKALYSRHSDKEVFGKALPFAKTMEELGWLASRNNHKQPLASRIVDRMASVAVSFDDWRKVHFYSGPENPWHAEAFAKMKALAAV